MDVHARACIHVRAYIRARACTKHAGCIHVHGQNVHDIMHVHARARIFHHLNFILENENKIKDHACACTCMKLIALKKTLTYPKNILRANTILLSGLEAREISTCDQKAQRRLKVVRKRRKHITGRNCNSNI